MLEQAKPDAVIVANPNTLHVSTALDCLAAGVPVLLEKPVGVHLDEARELVAASKASGRSGAGRPSSPAQSVDRPRP